MGQFDVDNISAIFPISGACDLDLDRSSSLLAFKNSLKNIDLTYTLFGKM